MQSLVRRPSCVEYALTRWFVSVFKRSRGIGVAIFSILLCYGSASEGQTPSNQNEVLVFDYDQDLPAMVVQVNINGVQTNAILDTGSNYLVVDDKFRPSLGTELSAEKVHEITGFRPDEQTAITHAGRVKVDYFGFPNAHLHDIKLHGKISIAKDLSFISAVLGVELGAIIGTEQLTRFAVYFDKSNGRIVLGENADSFDVSLSNFERANLFPDRSGLPMVSAYFGGTEIPLTIDTGTNSFASLHPSAIEKLQAEATSVSEMGASIHTAVQSQIVRLDSIVIAGHDFRSQLVNLGAFNSLGFGALMHSNFILSMPDRSLYMQAPLEPVGRGELDKSGLRLLTQQGSIVVFQAADDSPAFKAGLRPNDTITHFNDRRVQASDVWYVRNALRGQPGKNIIIDFKRGGNQGEARFKLSGDDIP